MANLDGIGLGLAFGIGALVGGLLGVRFAMRTIKAKVDKRFEEERLKAKMSQPPPPPPDFYPVEGEPNSTSYAEAHEKLRELMGVYSQCVDRRGRLRGEAPRGPMGMRAYANVHQITDHMLELEKSIDNMQEEIADLEKREAGGDADQIKRMAEKYNLKKGDQS